MKSQEFKERIRKFDFAILDDMLSEIENLEDEASDLQNQLDDKDKEIEELKDEIVDLKSKE